jgi:hypothetical protein
MINKLQLVILGVVIVYGAQNNAMEVNLKRSCGAEAKEDVAKLKVLIEKKHKIEPNDTSNLYYDSPCGGKVYYRNDVRFYQPYNNLKNSGCTYGCP